MKGLVTIMPSPPKILAFAGSTRRDSYNKKLISIAAEGAREAGAEVQVIDLRDYPLPIFDEDLEREGTPENALLLKKILGEHQGLLIASPEYNSSVTAVLKNMIDWVSRPGPLSPGLVAFSGKVAGLMSASPGALGGLRGLVHLRAILGNIQVLVLPHQVAIPNAHEVFSKEGTLTDEKIERRVKDLGSTLASIVAKLNQP